MSVVALQHGQKSRLARRNALRFFCEPQPDPRESVAPPIQGRNEEHPMMDILMLALGFGFFALAIGYTYACERL